MTTTNQISPSTIVRTWTINPASGGFGEYDVYSDPSEWAEFCAHFDELPCLHSSEFDTEQIEDISGRIHGEAGRGELYAWLDRGEWMYCLVEEQTDEDIAEINRAADLKWADKQYDAIEATREAVIAFDESEDGARYKAITGMTMWENLGGDTL